MRAENADSVGRTRFPIQPATLARIVRGHPGPGGGLKWSDVQYTGINIIINILEECKALWGEPEQAISR